MQVDSLSKRLVRVVLAMLLGAAGAGADAATATAAPTHGPAVRLIYGSELDGPQEAHMSAPERQDSKYGGPLLVVTIVNTGDVPLTVTGLGLNSPAATRHT